MECECLVFIVKQMEAEEGMGETGGSADEEGEVDDGEAQEESGAADAEDGELLEDGEIASDQDGEIEGDDQGMLINTCKKF